MVMIAHFVSEWKLFYNNIVISQDPFQFLDHPAVEGRLGTAELPGVRKEDLHDPLAGEHVDDGPDLAELGVAFASELQIQGISGDYPGSLGAAVLKPLPPLVSLLLGLLRNAVFKIQIGRASCRERVCLRV